MKYSLALIASFLAGYGAASLGMDTFRRRYTLDEMSTEQVKSRTEVASNVVKLTPREEASLRSLVRWQVDPELLREENAGA